MSADGPVNILLVDDRQENLVALEAVLEPLGQNLLRAQSGEEALRRLLHDDVAVILLDVQMPGLDGFETAAHIKGRERTSDIPIIFITAISRESHHALRGYSTGAVDYIAKPVDPWLLQAKVRVFLELHAKNELLKRQRELLAQRLDERYRVEEALSRQASELERSNAELEQFAYVASHDLQQPLRVVAGYLDLLHERFGDVLGEDGTHLIDRAVGAAGRMDQLIRDLLEYSRVGTALLSGQGVDCQVALDRALANLQAAIEESDATITARGLPMVACDPSQLIQLFQNLVSNAIKFRSGAPPVIQVEGEYQDAECVVSVTDNGLGIEPHDAERIFTMFGRAHGGDRYPGTGIGLAICKKIVERHGGRLWMKPAPGGGSTFLFSLPGAA